MVVKGVPRCWAQPGGVHAPRISSGRSPSESMPRLACLSCGTNHNEKKRQWPASVFQLLRNEQSSRTHFVYIKKIKAQSDKTLKNLQSSLSLQIKIQKLYDSLNLLRKPFRDPVIECQHPP